VNYLAHLFLSSQSDDALIGALLGDFVKGPLGERYPPAILHAIKLHRSIDTYTDAHAVVLLSKTRVNPSRRRYAGIMVDMFYDHFLARMWADYTDEALDDFVRRVYAILRTRADELPPRLQRIAPGMIESDWLRSYREVDAIARALERMGTRLRRGNGLIGSGADLVRHYTAFEQDFRLFFADAIGFVRMRTVE
jgi:acyl carrier protein phosphodiesterase